MARNTIHKKTATVRTGTYLALAKHTKVGVIIVTFNAQDHIVECIRAVLRTRLSVSYLIVDNVSTDNTVSTIRKTFPKAIIVQNAKNIGYAAACNIGIRYFQKKVIEYILLLTPDTIISRSLIPELVMLLERGNRIGIAGPIITYAEQPKTIYFAGGYFNRMFAFSLHPDINKKLNETNIVSKPVDFITGACLFLRTSMLKKTGFMPDRYFVYFEDVFFCKKSIDAGFLCYLLAKPLATYYGVYQISPTKAYYLARNPLLYIKKQVNGLHMLSCLFGQFFIRLPYYAWQTLKRRDIVSLFSYLRGLHDGIR